MKVEYPEDMTMREARRRYFEANAFGPNGGYDDAWVDFKLGPIPCPFPNSKSRVNAVKYHDLHHVVTGYQTDIVGEFEISAWEIAAGCRSFVAAWILNLGGIAGGIVRAPRRTFAAFVRGRRDRTVYGEDLDVLLDATVGDVRRRCTGSEPPKATLADFAIFLPTAIVAFLVATVTFWTFMPLVPFGLLAHWLRKSKDPLRSV
jgi:hypothetical protein